MAAVTICSDFGALKNKDCHCFSIYLPWSYLYAGQEATLRTGHGTTDWFQIGNTYIGRNDAKAETPVIWPPHAKSWLIGKDSAAGRDWGQEEKGTTEDEMAGWHNWLDGRESGWTPGVGDGQGGLACCDSWGRKESDTTEWLIWSDLMKSNKNVKNTNPPQNLEKI